MSLNDILEIQKIKKDKEQVLFNNIYERVKMKINNYVKMSYVECVYEIPPFVYGFQLFSIPRVKEYILHKLNLEGFIALSVNENKIYISWELSSILDKTLKKEKKFEKIERMKDDRDDDLIKALIQSKHNRSYKK